MPQKPQILVFVDWYLPGYKGGGPIRSVANMVKALSDTFEFWVVTSDTDFQATKPYPNVEANTWCKGPQGEKVMYLSAEHQNAAQIKTVIADFPGKVIYLNSLFSIPFSLTPLRIGKKMGKQIVLAPRGMLGEGALKIKALKKKLFLKISNLTGLHRGIYWHASTLLEEQEIKTHFGRTANVQVALNLAEGATPVAQPRTKTVGHLKVFFLSRISPKKNLTGALQMLQQVPENAGQIEFDIFGPVDDQDYWQQCQEEIRKMPQHVTVSVKGEVEHSKLGNVLQPQHLMLLPTFNENYGHVILEALSNGCALLISDQTPWRNLQQKKVGFDLPLQPNGPWVEAIKQCMAMTQDEFNALSANAAKMATDFQSNAAAKEQNLNLFLSVH